MKLRIADNLVLSSDYVVATAGAFATKGMGKSHLAQVMAEEMLECGQVIVAIDPTDAWWGLRASADGKSEGYPVVVIGGDHGDLKLEAGAAVQLAEAIVAERFSCVICTDGMSDMAETKFVREFLDTVYRKNRKPIHIFIDEADVFAPQKAFDVEDNRCIRAMSHVVRRGRKKGIGTTLITQRPAELNASVRTMVEMLFVLGMSHNLDIDAVEKWLRLRKKKRGNNAAFELQEEMIGSLDSLQRGDAWAWAPRLGIHRRFRAREKRTFDSGATPKPGKKIKAPKKLAPVDLQRLGQAMAVAVQRQKENDPQALKVEVAKWKKAHDALQTSMDREIRQKLDKDLAKVKEKIVVKEVEVVRPADLRRLEALVKKIDKLILRITGTNADLELHLSGLRAEASKLQEVATRVTQLRGKKAGALVGEVLKMAPEAPIEKSWSKGDPLHHAYLSHPPKPTKLTKPPKATKPSKPTKPMNGATTPRAATNGSSEPISGAERRILEACAWMESIGHADADSTTVAFLAGYTVSGHFTNLRGKLRSAGLVEYPSGGTVRLTDAGRDAAPDVSRPTTIAALHEAVLDRLDNSAGRILKPLIEVYPKALTAEESAEASGYTVSGHFTNLRGRLHTMGLVTYPRPNEVRAADLLFPAGLS